MTKPKTCRICHEEFLPRSTTAKVCRYECALILANQIADRETRKKALQERSETRRLKEKLKSRGQWLRECQVVFNAWIRKRDEGLPCISSGRTTGKMNAGHYRSVGSAPELRFEPLNCHVQSEKDNSYLSGNLINYRINLIKKIGIEKVEWLESKHEPKKYTIQELKEIKAYYKSKLKGMP